ncbi:TetR/AcrR family transcriptional regulator [Cupriavidus nantongensis]|uniref:TetR family transcriptional regulator n=1 Tax=Cupriavidus nantongensis TaxID=1796606 RepID=A0A142JEX6_9BURK|nr:TetR/AcrR family transcriptional regulator [Cupriavidus nantongensis]AMR76638.1 TetR family transcriptional regulator [Cupriavidus nantongensis]
MFARNQHVARTNRERTETTRQALTEAARALFVSRGYAETSTPDVCAAAGITRGALYHHFADKRDLFRHVLAEEAAAVAADIEAATPPEQNPAEALLNGAQAYLQAMTVPGRTRLLLVEGPAVLGLREMLALDEANAARTLREGLAAAGVDAAGVAPLLSAAFDRAALEIEAGADAGRVREAMLWLLRRVLGQGGR